MSTTCIFVVTWGRVIIICFSEVVIINLYVLCFLMKHWIGSNLNCTGVVSKKRSGTWEKPSSTNKRRNQIILEQADNNSMEDLETRSCFWHWQAIINAFPKETHHPVVDYRVQTSSPITECSKLQISSEKKYAMLWCMQSWTNWQDLQHEKCWVK